MLEGYFEGIDSCVSLRFHPAKTGEIEAGKSHENPIQVASRRVSNYYFLPNISEIIH